MDHAHLDRLRDLADQVHVFARGLHSPAPPGVASTAPRYLEQAVHRLQAAASATFHNAEAGAQADLEPAVRDLEAELGRWLSAFDGLFEDEERRVVFAGFADDLKALRSELSLERPALEPLDEAAPAKPRQEPPAAYSLHP